MKVTVEQAIVWCFEEAYDRIVNKVGEELFVSKKYTHKREMDELIKAFEPITKKIKDKTIELKGDK